MSETTDFYSSWLGCASFGIGSSRALAAVSPSIISPLDISDCLIWFDANNGDTVTVDSKDNSAILTWQSLGSQSNTMVPDSNGTGYYNVDTINGLNVVQFPASNTMTWYGSIPGQEKTIFFVSKDLTDLTTILAPFMDNISGNATQALQIGHSYTGSNFVYVNCVNGLWCSYASDSNNPVSRVQMTSWRATSNLGSNFVHLNTSNLTLVDNYAVGQYNENPVPYIVNRPDGSSQDVAEIVLYNRALTDEEVGLVETYLLTKWGIP